MPIIIKNMLAGTAAVGSTSTGGNSAINTRNAMLLSAIPYAMAALAMSVTAWHSDRVGERTLHIGITAIIGSVFWLSFGAMYHLSFAAGFVSLVMAMMFAYAQVGVMYARVSGEGFSPALLSDFSAMYTFFHRFSCPHFISIPALHSTTCVHMMSTETDVDSVASAQTYADFVCLKGCHINITQAVTSLTFHCLSAVARSCVCFAAEPLEARHVAIGVAMFNAIGAAIGGFIGPYVTGAVVQRVGSFVQATPIQGSFLLASGVLATSLGIWEQLQKRQARQTIGMLHSVDSADQDSRRSR
jgi:hypothetical protein